MKFKTNATLCCLAVAVIAGQCFGTETENVKLEIRLQNKYEKSAYSFRYRSKEFKKHKNYVDIVYESGRMRINNHGGMEAKIADLGKMDGLDETANIKQEDAKWSQEALVPVAGNSYAMEIVEDEEKLVIVFHVQSVSDDELEFNWRPIGKGNWPIDLKRRGAAGTSGMSALPTVRKVEKSKAGSGG